MWAVWTRLNGAGPSIKKISNKEMDYSALLTQDSSHPHGNGGSAHDAYLV